MLFHKSYAFGLQPEMARFACLRKVCAGYSPAAKIRAPCALHASLQIYGRRMRTDAFASKRSGGLKATPANTKGTRMGALGKSVPDIRLRRRFARPAPCKRACRSTGGECEPTRLQANARTVDKAKEFCQFDKGFGRAFSKARAVEAA